MKSYFHSQTMLEFEDSCLRKSFLLRLRRRDTRWLIIMAVGFLPDRPWTFSETSLEIIQNNLKSLLEKEIRDTFGNPLVIFFLLRIILPTILRFVIERWLNLKAPEDKLDWIF